MRTHNEGARTNEAKTERSTLLILCVIVIFLIFLIFLMTVLGICLMFTSLFFWGDEIWNLNEYFSKENCVMKKDVKKNKIAKKIAIVIAGIFIFLGICLFVFIVTKGEIMLIFTPLVDKTMNENPYNTIEEAIQSEFPDFDLSKDEILYKDEHGNWAVAVARHKEQGRVYQYWIDESNQYHSILYSKTGFKSKIEKNNILDEKELIEEGIRSAVILSVDRLHVGSLNIKKYFDTKPVYGIIYNDKVKNIWIDGQPVDKLVPIQVDEEQIKFWIIYDLQTKKSFDEIDIEIEM